MVDMLSEVKDKFPSVFTKKGVLKKREPSKYVCSCGNTFSSLTTTFRTPSIAFGSPICKKCGMKAKDNVEYNIWRRMKNGQIEQEDFILNVVKERGYIEKEELEELLEVEFHEGTDALGTLVYFGYLTVDEKKRDLWGVIQYRISSKVKLDERYELIR